MSEAYELNCDGIVGTTHNYGGLSYGNVASIANQNSVSNPREAALQGLEKMKFFADKGIKQAVIPPQERPDVIALRRLGFCGSDEQVINHANKMAPELLIATSSSASMWTANAATISPSADSSDGKVHITPANLSSKFHRSIEASMTAAILKKMFENPHYFVHHDPLPAGEMFADEGAANHTRFCKNYGDPGLQLFVYGREAFGENRNTSKRYPARQTLEASQAIARLHQLPIERSIFAQQNPEAIDEGVFHNDVISIGNRRLFFYHEKAFLDTPQTVLTIRKKAFETCQTDMIFLEVKEDDISLKEAVASYLFNSQIVSHSNGKMLVAPIECSQNKKIADYLNAIVCSATNPIDEVHYLDLRQSMRNGGGPACLRLRVVLTDTELNAMNQHMLLTETLYVTLKEWIQRHYRETLSLSDMADPALLNEGRHALDELTQILHLGSIYSFQQALR